MHSDLLEVTRKLLKNRPRTLTHQQINHDTRLSISWLNSFAHGREIDPGVRKVETLYCYLTGGKLHTSDALKISSHS